MTESPPHDIVRAVRAELAVPGRYHLHPSGLSVSPSWLDLAIRWVRDAFGHFEQMLAARLHLSTEQSGVIGDAVIMACAVLVALIVARMLMSMQLERGAHHAQPLGSSRSALALSNAAQEAARAGDFARAIRLIFAASVVMLDLRGVVADDESSTVNELRRALRERASSAEPPFSEIARAYTAAAYAERDVDADVWTRAREAYARLAERAS